MYSCGLNAARLRRSVLHAALVLRYHRRQRSHIRSRLHGKDLRGWRLPGQCLRLCGGKAGPGIFRCNLRLAGQHLFVLLAHHDVAFFGHEADDQADIFLRPAYFVPGQPHAVRMAQFRLAVMRGQLVFSKNVFTIGLYVVWVAIGFIENVNCQCAVDFYGLRFVAGIK